MINLISIEGMLFKRPEEFTTESGKKFYKGSIVCYRDLGSKRYDYIDFMLNNEAYIQYLELVGDKKAKLLITGSLRTFKNTIPYIEVKYLALYTYSTNLKGSVKENVIEDVVEEKPITPESDIEVVPDDTIPF